MMVDMGKAKRRRAERQGVDMASWRGGGSSARPGDSALVRAAMRSFFSGRSLVFRIGDDDYEDAAGWAGWSGSFRQADDEVVDVRPVADAVMSHTWAYDRVCAVCHAILLEVLASGQPCTGEKAFGTLPSAQIEAAGKRLEVWVAENPIAID